MAHILHDADEFQEKPNERIRQRSHHEKQTKSEQRDSKEGQGEAAPLAVGNAAESAARDRPITGFRDKKNRHPRRRDRTSPRRLPRSNNCRGRSQAPSHFSPPMWFPALPSAGSNRVSPVARPPPFLAAEEIARASPILPATLSSLRRAADK